MGFSFIKLGDLGEKVKMLEGSAGGEGSTMKVGVPKKPEVMDKGMKF
jgi:hypothetical protein